MKKSISSSVILATVLVSLSVSIAACDGFDGVGDDGGGGAAAGGGGAAAGGGGGGDSTSESLVRRYCEKVSGCGEKMSEEELGDCEVAANDNLDEYSDDCLKQYLKVGEACLDLSCDGFEACTMPVCDGGDEPTEPTDDSVARRFCEKYSECEEKMSETELGACEEEVNEAWEGYSDNDLSQTAEQCIDDVSCSEFEVCFVE